MREEAREGAVSEAGFIINTGQKEVKPTQGSRGARSFLQQRAWQCWNRGLQLRPYFSISREVSQVYL